MNYIGQILQKHKKRNEEEKKDFGQNTEQFFTTTNLKIQYSLGMEPINYSSRCIFWSSRHNGFPPKFISEEKRQFSFGFFLSKGSGNLLKQRSIGKKFGASSQRTSCGFPRPTENEGKWGAWGEGESIGKLNYLQKNNTHLKNLLYRSRYEVAFSSFWDCRAAIKKRQFTFNK